MSITYGQYGDLASEWIQHINGRWQKAEARIELVDGETVVHTSADPDWIIVAAEDYPQAQVRGEFIEKTLRRPTADVMDLHEWVLERRPYRQGERWIHLSMKTGDWSYAYAHGVDIW